MSSGEVGMRGAASPAELSGASQTELLDAMDGVVYVTSLDGVVTAVAPTHWRRFAGENGAGERVAAGDVIGRSLYDFISGSEVRDLNRRLAAAVIEGERESVAIGARCDSPDFFRRIRLSISPIRVGGRVAGLLYQSILLEEALRPRMALFAPDGEGRHGPLVVICSYCHALRNDDAGPADGWRPAEDYYRQGGSSEVTLSHGICPDCFGDLQLQLG